MAEDPKIDEPEGGVESFLGQSTHELKDWRWLWQGDHTFPLQSHRGGPLGRLIVAFKKLLRPLVRAPQADLWDRQGAFNQVLISHLEGLQQSFGELGSDIQQVQKELSRDLRAVQAAHIKDAAALVDRIELLEDFNRDGLVDVMKHTDALFSRLDQKLDRVRRSAAELETRLRDLNA